MKKSKLLAIVITLALVVTMIPTTLFADGEEVTEYTLYVGGVHVTSENENDVFGDGGTVKYNSETNTLKLNNAKINMEYVEPGHYKNGFFGIVYYDSSRDLDILLEGRNSISGNYIVDSFGWGPAIFVNEHNNLIIGGNGSLDITVPDSFSDGYGIYTQEDTDILFEDNVDVNISTAGTGIRTNNISVKNYAKVKVDSQSDAVYMGQDYYAEDGSVMMDATAIFEVNASGEGGKAFTQIDTDGGNIDDITGLVGLSKSSVEDTPWTGDTDERKLTDYKFVRFPYAGEGKEVHFKPGDHGQGYMNDAYVFAGGQIELPKCTFTGEGIYGFDGWDIDGDKYRPGDKVTIDGETNVTATWTLSPLNLFIGGVHVTLENKDDVLGDGTVSVSMAEAPGEEPGLVQVTLDNATIECDRRADGEDSDVEYGIRYNHGGNYDLEIVLKGENKILNKKKLPGITKVKGIETHSAKSVAIKGNGTLEMNFQSQRKDGTYFGIHTLQKTTIQSSKINININGDYYNTDAFDVKGFYLESDQMLSLKDNAVLDIYTDNRYAFDNRYQNTVDLDVEEGCLFQAATMYFRNWGAIHGNKWVTFSDESIAQGVVCKRRLSNKALEKWDTKSEIGSFMYVRIPEVAPWYETDSLPEAGKYYLINNVELDKPWEVSNVEVELNLNGRTINSAGNFAKLTENANVTFTNSVPNHGSIKGVGDEVISIDDKSSLEMNSVSFYPEVTNSGKGIINNGTLKTRDTMIYARGNTTTPGYAIYNSGKWDSLSDNVMFIQADVGGIALYNLGEATITDTNMEASGAGDTQSYGIYQSGGGVVYLAGSTAVKGDAAGIKAVNEKSIYATSKDGKNSFVGDVITLDCNDKYAPYDKAVVLNVKKDIKDKFVLAAPENAELYYRNAKIFLVTKGSEPSEPETTAPTPKPTPTAKKANTIKVTAKKKTIKAKKLKKKSLKVKALKVKNAVGKVTFKKVKKGTTKKIYKKVKVTNKGILKFKKGKYKKKTYKIKVKIRAAGNANYLAKTLTKKVKVKIK